RFLLLGFLMVSLVGGCSARTLDVPQRTFASPDEAFWSYQKAVGERGYAEVFSYLSVDQRDVVGELFWWLRRYTQNGKETLRSLEPIESLPAGEQYVACFTIAGINPLCCESVMVENLHRDAVRMKWDGARRCHVFEYKSFSLGMWGKDPHIEVITERDGRYAIRLNYLWTGTDREGACDRREMIEACRNAIRAQDRLITQNRPQ
ncbi:MAG: hypothetical protein K8S55_05685, partial [Phycisphaerae bacterium]|nr:hypothetical protein [Phycisphaerae bacterium]